MNMKKHNAIKPNNAVNMTSLNEFSCKELSLNNADRSTIPIMREKMKKMRITSSNII